MRTAALPAERTTLAPDGSEIRELLQLRGGSVVHCTLPAGNTTVAVCHRTVEEIWYILAGAGELWRRDERQESGNGGARETVTALRPGLAVSLPLGVSFQFRTTGAAPLQFLICTMPPWPGPDEAIPVAGKWHEC